MPLKLNGDTNSLFSHNRDFDEGIKQRGIRPGQSTVVVALDGSGDAETIQEGIDMLPTTGGVVYIKEGIYIISKQISITNSNIELVGSGKSTQIKTSTTGWTVSNVYMIDGSANVGGGYRELYLNLEHSIVPTINGLDCGNNSIISFCWCDDGYSVIRCTNDCTIMQTKLTTGGFLRIVGDNNVMIGNTLNGAGGITISAGDRNIIKGNVITSGPGDGLWVSGDRNVIIGNTITNSALYGIRIVTGKLNNLIVGNMLNGNSSGGILDAGTNTQPNGAMGTSNLAFDDLNMIT